MPRLFRSLLSPVLTILALLAVHSVQANNIQVANATLTGNTGTTAQIQFDLSWENSWRGGGVVNWDAAWVFVKFRSSTTGTWLHAQLNNSGHVAPAGSQIDPGLLTPGAAFNASTNPVIGVFIYRSATGNGAFNLPAVQLNWNYGAQGLGFNDLAQVQVFAIEMVYVPQGAFAAGSGGAEAFPFTLTTINTGAANTVPAGTGSLGGQAGGYPTGQTAPAATWPNGFNAFYCMKYEVSQQGYVDLLNTLTYTQQVTRTTNAPTSVAGTGALVTGNAVRNGIDIQTPGVASTTPAVYACNLDGDGVFGEAVDGRDLACNYLSWADLSAYLDWSGLRPLTELEFEKTCRGTIAPLANAYPWGTTSIAFSTYTMANPGAGNEGIATNYSTVAGNASYNNTSALIAGPNRVGIFAAHPSNSGRITAGSSYYGSMELGGCMFERSVTIGTASGRAYTGTHGNGALTASGDPDGSTWPTPGSADGSGFRGGGFNATSTYVRVSDRADAAFIFISRDVSTGGRGVRTAP